MAELDIALVADVEIDLIKGDDKDYEFVIKTAAGTGVDVSSGYTARLQARVGGVAGSHAIALDSAAGNGLTMGNGKITMALLAAKTALLAIGRSVTAGSVVLPFELEIIKAGTPSQVKTVASGTITVKDKLVGPVLASGVTLDKASLALVVGGAAGTLTATVAPTTTTDKTVVWSSSDVGVATVVDGTVTAVGGGVCSIVATCGLASVSCPTTITEVRVASITLDKETASTTVGGADIVITPTVLPADASFATVAWSTSDPLIATVVAGTVAAVGVGVCTITAQAETKTAACVVTIGT